MEPRFWKWTLLILIRLAWAAGVKRLETEKEILQDIFMINKFHMYVRPEESTNQTASNPLEVSVSLYILNLDIDTENQECNIQMYFRQEWNDSRLSFKDQDELHFLSIHDAVGLWTPDLFFVNEKTGQFHVLTKPNTFIRIFPQGNVLYSQRLSVKLSCLMDLRNYPFDHQTCTLPIESYGYTANDLKLKWKPDATFGVNEPSDFQVSYSISEEIIHVGENKYSRLELNIHLGRLASAQLIHIYVPLSLLVVASWISFWFRPSCHLPRLTTATLMTFTSIIYLQSVKGLLFRQNYLTALDIWIGFSVLLIFGAFFQNVYVLANQKELELPTKNDGISSLKDTLEAQKTDKEESQFSKFLAGKLSMTNSNADMLARITFPSIFVFFNFIYFLYLLI